VGERLDRRLVAVMFTDMAGYTALMQADEHLAVDRRDRYVSALERHHDAFGGTIVQRLGDGSMSMFPSSLAAVMAGIAIQRELAALQIPVRIGVHVGEVIVEPERLTGDAVNLAARIESFAVPGGVMLSDSAYEQIRNRGDIDVVGLGRFRLKNVGRMFELYAVAADGVVVPEPGALQGKGERFASLPSNLPDPVAPLVGRAADLAGLARLARDQRVITITGPGGVGKTRILAELGRLLAPEFLDGVAFVALADVTDPAGFLPAVAQALDVKEAEGRALGDGVVSLIGDRKALLLLDNFEQIVPAASAVAELARRCPRLRIVTTSRMPLRIAAEREYPLGPLALPPASDPDSAEALLGYPAVALFAQRAARARGSFELTSQNAGAVAAICRRLDGLPLALELAAARLRLLSAEALLERLGHALDVLTSGPRDVERHQTLRATIGWSHSLLTGPERRLFRRMAVFAGGCALPDLEAICADPGDTCLDELDSLVEKALVQVDGQSGRLRMLQTIGEFAREQLEAAGETGDIALRHARRYALLACEIRDGTEGTGQRRSVERGVADEGNLQAALDTLLAAARGGDAAACETGLRMCGDLLMYWHIRGKNLTAREYATSLLDADTAPATAGRASALVTAGLASWALGQFERSNREWAEAHRIAAEVGAERELCVSAWLGAIGMIGFDLDAGLRWAGQGLETSARSGSAWSQGMASTVDGILQTVAGDLGAAQARYAQALDIQRRIGDEEGAGLSLGGLAQLASIRGDLAGALELYRQALAAFEAIGDRAEEARILSEMAWSYLRNTDSVLARRAFLDSVQAYTDVASVRGVGLSLIGLAATEAAEHRPGTAVQIAAAAEVYASQEGIVNVYSDETPGRELIDQAQAALPAEDAAHARETGRRLTIKEALDLVRIPQQTPA
jgi:predicted ATPase/class 3 adenylate cyclase